MSSAREAYRLLPSVDEVLREPDVERLAVSSGRELLLDLVKETLDGWRKEISQGGLDVAGLQARIDAGALAREVAARLERERSSGLARAVNATGVVLHTGLGRAPVHPEVAEAMAEAARSYCVLEVERETGGRSQRDARLGELLCRLTGAEAGIAVNNNAAAVVLVLQTFAGGRDAIVSRGELVEIGGSFRMPDVMERAGVSLREVGTTNRTRIADYEAAITERTGLLLKVHTSNFRVEGFTEEVSGRELAELGKRRGLPTSFDLGSGLAEGFLMQPLDMLGEEPLIKDSVDAGIDAVTFSGDKLLGGPQAGLIVGARDALTQLRKNPLYRALRLDKVSLCGLERTVELVLAGRGDEIPSRAMMLRKPDDVLEEARALAAELCALPGCTVEVQSDQSQPGSGSAPGVFLETFVVRLTHATRSVDALAHALRTEPTPVFARIADGALVFDPRTLLPGDHESLVDAMTSVTAGS